MSSKYCLCISPRKAKGRFVCLKCQKAIYNNGHLHPLSIVAIFVVLLAAVAGLWK